MRQLFLKLLLFVFSIAVLASCNKDLGGNPTLEFFTEGDYTWENDSVAPGDTVLVGLKCTWNGKDKLTNVNVFRNDALFETIEISTNDREGVGFGKKYEKSAADKDSFVFELNDEAGQKASLNLVLYKDTASADVKEIEGIVLGAQNSTGKQLYSISKQLSYTITEADNSEDIQKVIDLVAAHDNDNALYIGSPATNFNSIYDFSGWAETDTTYFVETDYTDDIYGLLNLTKIKNTFDNASDEEKKKKAKNLTQGDMYVFKAQSKKYGVIKVNEVINGATGSVDFTIKVQR